MRQRVLRRRRVRDSAAPQRNEGGHRGGVVLQFGRVFLRRHLMIAHVRIHDAFVEMEVRDTSDRST
jgi:hypothetical protein